MIREQRDRVLNPYWEGFRNDDIAEDDYSEESDANSVYIESRNIEYNDDNHNYDGEMSRIKEI